MNVPRYWRKNSQRYRLVGVQYTDGQKSLVNRPQANKNQEPETKAEKERGLINVSAA